MEPSGVSKRLRLRRADRCARCGQEFSPGDEALWYAEVKLVTCLECPGDVPDDGANEVDPAGGSEVKAGTAGASAQREYDRRRQKREDHGRDQLGSLGVALARLINEPQGTQAWRKGAKGEAFTGQRLEKHLAGTGVNLLHDRRIPGHGNANIDHIAVGPGGITVIDTKNYRGKVKVERIGGLFSERRTILTIAGQDRTKLVKAVEIQVDLVRAVLADTDHADVDVVGALCFADVDGLPLLTHQQLLGVTIDGPRRVATLANRAGHLDETAIHNIWHIIGLALPAA
jgi:hypothetical protein